MAILEDIQNSQVVRSYRKGYLAWLGAHKAAFELAQDNMNKIINGRDELLDDLVQKGEAVETAARERATGFFGRTAE